MPDSNNKFGGIMKSIKIVLISAIWFGVGVGIAFAHGPDPSDEEAAYIARDGLMHLIAAQRGIIRNMAEGRTPVNDREFIKAAKALESLFSITPRAFEKNLMVDDSLAKPEIWQNWDDFVAKAEELRKVAAEIAATAEIRGAEAAKEMVGNLDCGSCHDPYRVER
jgi:cytochrome c556